MLKKRFICFYILLVTSCNSYNDGFWEFLFKTDEISLTRICNDNPSVFSEGVFHEVYTISKEGIDKVTEKIFTNTNKNKYLKYKDPKWKKTPIVNESDSILSFVHNQISIEENKCFSETEVKTVLIKKGNYYLPLYDDLGRLRLFVLDTKSCKLFLITSYIL